jgi:regulator of protease activity HflC (stomatin/prohibitin superfamily)
LQPVKRNRDYRVARAELVVKSGLAFGASVLAFFRPDVEAERRDYKGATMKSVVRNLILGVVVVIIAVTLSSSFLFNWKIIPPGYTGIKVNRLVDKGVTHEDTTTGFVFYNPVQTALVIYPTFVQRVVWTHDLNEGNPVNEELTFNTKDSVPVSLDVAVSYALAAQRVPDFYVKFRADKIETFTHGFLRDTARNVVVAVGSEYTFDDVNGPKKEEFLDRIAKQLDAKVNVYGVSIQQFGLIGSLRPPQALLEAVSAKTKAIQDSIRTENEVRSAQAEAKKRVAIAEGEAAANRALVESIDPKLLDWERLKLQKDAIAKWNGVMPTVISGGEGGMLFNIPVAGAAAPTAPAHR